MIAHAPRMDRLEHSPTPTLIAYRATVESLIVESSISSKDCLRGRGWKVLLRVRTLLQKARRGSLYNQFSVLAWLIRRKQVMLENM